MRRKIAAGNWKMNGLLADLDQISALSANHQGAISEILMCPPAPLIPAAVAETRGGPVAIGAQDCHANLSGAHTGDISASLLNELGATYTILGHSERRVDYGETDAQVQAKLTTALAANLRAILCVGESLSDREAERTLDVIAEQLMGSIPDQIESQNLVIAYEPIWAIGTGLIPTLAQIEEVHSFIRTQMSDRFGPGFAKNIRILYGGSVKPSNAAEIFQLENVDGALVGGASLKQADFSQIINALDMS
jgi:triosephosphate isomerase